MKALVEMRITEAANKLDDSLDKVMDMSQNKILQATKAKINALTTKMDNNFSE